MISTAGYIDGKQLMLVALTEEQYQSLIQRRSQPTWLIVNPNDEFGNYQILIDVGFDISQLS